MENQIFKVEIETGEIKDAELITIVSIDGKEYAIYMIENDMGSVDILASYVQKDAEGYDRCHFFGRNRKLWDPGNPPGKTVRIFG